MTGSTSLLEERLERSMVRLAEAVDSALELESVMTTRRVGGSPDRTRRWLLAVAAATVVLLGGVGVWMRDTDSSNRSVSGPTDSGTVDPDAPPLYLPTSVPEGFDLVEATYRTDDETTLEVDLMVLAVPAGSGWRDAVHVMLNAYELTDGEVVYDWENVELADGTPAEIARDDTNGTTYLQWTAPSGDRVIIVSDVVSNQSVAAHRLVAVADALTIAESRMSVGGELPDGLQVVVPPSPLRLSGTSSHLTYDGGDGRLLMVNVTVDPPDGWQFLGMSDDLEPVTIRGRAGFTSEHVYPPTVDSATLRRIGWLERSGVLIEVWGDGFSLPELTAFAATLAPVDEATWESVTDDLDVPGTTP